MGRSVQLVTLALVTSFVAAEAATPVQKVLGMLDDVGAKTKTDLAAAVSDFKEFSTFCASTAVEKDYSMKKSTETIAALDAAIYDAGAKIKQCEETVTELSSQISSTNGELAKTTSVREKEHADFLENEKELVDAVETLKAAASVSAASLAQMTPVMTRRLATIRASLKVVVEAGFVTHAQKAKVASFLAAREDADLSLHAKDTGAQQELIQQLVGMTEGTISDMRKKEAEAQHEFMSSKLTLESQIKSMEDEMKAQQQQKQTTTQSLAQATKDQSIEKKVLAEDSAYASTLKNDCNTRAQDFETQYKDAMAELKALDQASAILTKGVTASLVETKMKLARRMQVQSSKDDGKAQALRAIQALGRRLHSTALVSLAYRAAADPFTKIRGMVEEMIAKLEHEAAEAATQKAFCEEEQATSEKSRAKKQQKLDTTSARIEKAESTVAQLSEAVAELSGEVTELNAALAEATRIRTKESAAFAKVSVDLSSSTAACNEAATVLEAYYEGASALLQSGQKGGGSIISVLRFAESDFAMQLSAAKAAESTAVTKFTELQKETKLLTTTKLVEVKGKESEIKSLKTALSNFAADKEGVSSELEAVMQYIEELKPKCAQAPAESYAAKKARRTQEIEGLREALEMLA